MICDTWEQPLSPFFVLTKSCMKEAAEWSWDTWVACLCTGMRQLPKMWEEFGGKGETRDLCHLLIEWDAWRRVVGCCLSARSVFGRYTGIERHACPEDRKLQCKNRKRLPKETAFPDFFRKRKLALLDILDGIDEWSGVWSFCSYISPASDLAWEFSFDVVSTQMLPQITELRALGGCKLDAMTRRWSPSFTF